DREAIRNEIAGLKEALAVERTRALEIAAELAVARAKASEDQALIAQQKLRIAKLERQIYGQRSELARLIEQLSLMFEELLPKQLKTSSRPIGLSPRRRRCADLAASAPSGRRSRSIFHASGW